MTASDEDRDEARSAAAREPGRFSLVIPLSLIDSFHRPWTLGVVSFVESKKQARHQLMAFSTPASWDEMIDTSIARLAQHASHECRIFDTTRNLIIGSGMRIAMSVGSCSLIAIAPDVGTSFRLERMPGVDRHYVYAAEPVPLPDGTTLVVESEDPLGFMFEQDRGLPPGSQPGLLTVWIRPGDLRVGTLVVSGGRWTLRERNRTVRRRP